MLQLLLILLLIVVAYYAVIALAYILFLPPVLLYIWGYSRLDDWAMEEDKRARAQNDPARARRANAVQILYLYLPFAIFGWYVIPTIGIVIGTLGVIHAVWAAW